MTLTQLATTLVAEANDTHCMNDVDSDKSVYHYTREVSAYSSLHSQYFTGSFCTPHSC